LRRGKPLVSGDLRAIFVEVVGKGELHWASVIV
jgi:hypothetical protein